MKLSEVDRSKLAPMMRHYASLKDKYQDVILFYRLGDFYEMFFEDAELVSHELELTLTGRNAGLEERLLFENNICDISNNLGINAVSGKVCDLYEEGIIDPVLVEKTALMNAISVSGMLITTECGIALKKSEDEIM